MFCFKLYHFDHNNALVRQICIAFHRRYYRLFRKYINAYTLMKHLTKLKRTNRFAYVRKLSSQAVQDIAQRIDRAYPFGQKVVRVLWYGYFQSRRIEGRIKTITVKRDAVGDMYQDETPRLIPQEGGQ